MVRELWEETGLAGVELGPCVWTREKAVVLFGELTHGIERYFVARVAGLEVSDANQFDYERAVYSEVRWWPVDAIRASDETFYPIGLADLLEPVIAGYLPSPPIAIDE